MSIKELTAENTFSDELKIADKEFTLSIRGIVGSTVTLQRKRQTEADSEYRDVVAYTVDGEYNGNSVGTWLYRAGPKTGEYGSGTITVDLSE